MTVRRGLLFRRVSRELHAACAELGIPVGPERAEQLLTRQVERIAGRLGISDREALESYFAGDWPRSFAWALSQRLAWDLEEQGGEPPRLLTAEEVGRLVSTLAQAVAYAAANVASEAQVETFRVTAVGTAALAELGDALRRRTGGTVVVPGATVARTRTALELFLRAVSSGSWRDCWCAVPSHEHADPGPLISETTRALSSVA